MLVFDATALVAVLNSTGPAYTQWQRADAQRITIAVPALALVEAADVAGTQSTAWSAILWSPTMKVMRLTRTIAVEIGGQPGTPAARHAAWESHHLGWPILTCDGSLYGRDVDFLVV